MVEDGVVALHEQALDGDHPGIRLNRELGRDPPRGSDDAGLEDAHLDGRVGQIPAQIAEVEGGRAHLERLHIGAAALLGSRDPLLHEQGHGSSDRHGAHAVRRTELSLRGEAIAAAVLALDDALAQQPCELRVRRLKGGPVYGARDAHRDSTMIS